MDTNAGARRQTICGWKFRDEARMVEHLLRQAPYAAAAAAGIEASAANLVRAARADKANHSLLDTFLAEYGLSSKEGIALMCLAESLLRIPDRATAERLIADRIGFADWAAHAGKSGSLLVNASTWALMLGSKLVEPERNFASDPKTWLGGLGHRLGEPVVETAMRSAMSILGREFVLGSTIEKALQRSPAGTRHSWDMLGEAARDAAGAARYQQAYRHAIDTVAARREGAGVVDPSVSIKLSALHPRYEYSQHGRVIDELVPLAAELCRAAAAGAVAVTIDAEEADRLELSLDVFERLLQDKGAAAAQLGFVVQAYGKRALPLLEWLAAQARAHGRRIPVRLVKGAYWDAEIKHAQAQGYPGFPVYTRKCATDLSWLVCAAEILRHPDALFGQFATHNAHGVAAIMHLAGDNRDFEFQRLYGMGQALYVAANREYEAFPELRTYAPVGSYDDLLPYLVRRLLENGANSSFVHRLLDEKADAMDLVRDPIAAARAADPPAHPSIALPASLFAPRVNSSGADLSNGGTLAELRNAYKKSLKRSYSASALPAAESGGGQARQVANPADQSDMLGEVRASTDAEIEAAFQRAAAAQPEWDRRGGEQRARVLEAFADSLEALRPELIAILCREAGKTLADAVDEIREAVDFCRYYAAQARERFEEGTALPGPTGESNELKLGGRGVFVCISPWNFPLAIFCGQICAALAAGNTVAAKPAEETPIIAFEAVRLLHAAGAPQAVCNLLIGDGAVGDRMVRHPLCAGVAFTGSTETARRINRAMAESDGPIAPLIAETGGQNAMIVDSTALLEQVTDDVIRSAFFSAGQRCSALRVLYLQREIADKAIAMMQGAMDEIRVGDPARIESDVGPIISQAAADGLQAHINDLKDRGRLLHQASLSEECAGGIFVAPTLARIESIADLDREHFGPILHVILFDESDFDKIPREINSTGFGLTFGIHTRIESRMAKAASAIAAGNVYANRNMTGAVVGSQPFGGRGLSGTGPKAGGPHYLLRFAMERVVTINTVATGGNAELLSLDGQS